MLSRVAHLAYWMARYLERAESSARIVDVNTQLVLDAQGQHVSEETAWEPIIHVLADDKVFHKSYPRATETAVIEYILFDTRNPNSIVSCINTARENARCIREQLSTETWERLNRLYLDLRVMTMADYQSLGSGELLSQIRTGIQQFYGVAASMLPRNETWQFYELGRFLERADNTSRLIDVKYFTLLPDQHDVGGTLDAVQWGAVLRSCSAFEAFRKSRRGVITAERVVDYLILDEYFPRSIRFAITHAEEALRWISRDTDHHYSNSPTRALGRLRADFDYTVISDIIAQGLHEWIDQLQTRISSLQEEIQATYFFYELDKAKILA